VLLSISQDQIDALTDTRIRLFAEELAERARGRKLEICDEMPAEALVDALAGEVRAARSYGFRYRQEMTRFSDIALTLGFGFSDREPWADGVFSDQVLGPGARLDKAERIAVFASRRS